MDVIHVEDIVDPWSKDVLRRKSLSVSFDDDYLEEDWPQEVEIPTEARILPWKKLYTDFGILDNSRYTIAEYRENFTGLLTTLGYKTEDMVNFSRDRPLRIVDYDPTYLRRDFNDPGKRLDLISKKLDQNLVRSNELIQENEQLLLQQNQDRLIQRNNREIALIQEETNTLLKRVQELI